MKRQFLLAIFCLLSADLAAQGFRMMNGRNHPYLNWQVAETEHFRIIYPDHLTEMTGDMAAIAEASYSVLSENLEMTFDRRIRLYFSDTDEISNGFAVPAGNGFANMWVNVNDYAEIWTGREKWLRKVIAHELAHLFHFKATRTNLGLLNYVAGDPVPGFWAEGLAQYYTEKWDSERGDRWLRLSVFDSRPGYDDRQSIHNRRLYYASGNAQVRYFSETYGDSALAGLLQKRRTLIGPLRYYSFEKSFREGTGRSYRQFHEEWRKHMNIYYNTLASQMDRVDSLKSDPENLPGQYYYDVRYSPDQSRTAVLSLVSLDRPVRRLFIVDNDSSRSASIAAEGAVNGDLSWSPDGRSLVYSRQVRGKGSSLVNDIFLLDTETFGERRVTSGRRAVSPVFGPEGERLAYIVNDEGTANVVVLEFETGRESYLTHYEGDVQLIHLIWNQPGNELVYQRFDEEGNRNLIVLDPETGGERILDDGMTDNRMPRVSPDGSRIAFTSLRDEVPNVFVMDLDSDSTWRVTHLFTGGEVFDWLAAADTTGRESLIIKASETKTRDHIFRIDAGSVRNPAEPDVNPAYAAWRIQEPAHTLPLQIEPDNRLIGKRYSYNSWKHLTHAVTFGLPWYAGPEDFGLFAVTGWIEPLGKHQITAGGLFSIGNPSHSYGLFSYVNNQLYPTLRFSVYRAPVPAQFYGRNYLFEELTGTELTLQWPLDYFDGPYRKSRFESRARYVSIHPLSFGSYRLSWPLPVPQAGKQLDFRLSWLLRKQRPYVRHLLHPVDGYGIQFTTQGAGNILGTDTTFLTAEAGSYMILPVSALHRLYLSARLQVQFGEPFPQHYIGFSSIDNIRLPFETGFVTSGSFPADRVRGYRDFAAGKQVAFVSAEYRMPFLPSLGTSVLGFFRLGATSLNFFADAGSIWNVTVSETDDEVSTVRRLGLGTEIKNIVGIGPLRLIHSLGAGQPGSRLFGPDYDLYYRVSASVPF